VLPVEDPLRKTRGNNRTATFHRKELELVNTCRNVYKTDVRVYLETIVSINASIRLNSRKLCLNVKFFFFSRVLTHSVLKIFLSNFLFKSALYHSPSKMKIFRGKIFRILLSVAKIFTVFVFWFFQWCKLIFGQIVFFSSE